MNTEKLTWYVARSGGIVAWCLLALSLTLGLLLAGRMLGRKTSPAWILSVHRFLGGVSVLFTVVAIMLDDFVDFGFVDVLVPWAATWKPTPVAWGIIAMYLAIAVEASSFAMKRLPRKLWRAIHWSSAPLFGLATLHGYQSGTDAGRGFIIAIVVAMTILAIIRIIRVTLARRRTEPKTDPRQTVAEAKARRLAQATARLDQSPAVPAPALYDQEPVLVHATAAPPAQAEPHEDPAATGAVPPAATHQPADAVGGRVVLTGSADSEASHQPEESAGWFGNIDGEPHVDTSDNLVGTGQPDTTAAAPKAVTPLAPPAADAIAPSLPPPPVEVTAPPRGSSGATETQSQPGPDELAAVGVSADQHDTTAQPNAAPSPPPPRPSWALGSGGDDATNWVTADPAGNPDIKRSEGPVPGVWKRTRRDLTDYVDPAESN